MSGEQIFLSVKVCLIFSLSAVLGLAVDKKADLVLLNGKIWTVDRNRPVAEAVAVKGDRIVAVGSTNEIRQMIDSHTRIINLKGKLVVPGFNDAHTHFVEGGFTLLGINLRDAKDEQDFARRIAERAKFLPKGQWITGGDWDHEAWPSKKHPTKELIDSYTPETPVFVTRLDGHIGLANSLALKLAGITKDTPDPQGGEIVKDPQSGEPTGILKDTAMDLVYKVIPPPSIEARLKAAKAALAHAAKYGVTSIQDNSTAADLKIYQQLLKKGELTVRVYAWRSFDNLEHFKALGIEGPFGNNMLRVGCIKMFSDGSMGAGTALFFEPYNDDPITCGLQIHPVAELNKMIGEVDRAGLQAAVHAIGDKANHLVLNAFEEAIKANGYRDSRHRIEHAQVITPEDVKRFVELGVIASIEPSHCIDDMRWAEKRIGYERCKNAYRFKSLIDAGVKVAFGTDWPVEPLNPMLGLYAAVTREFAEGGPEGGWFPEEKITMAQAIELYTLGSAYAEFAENVKGSIQVGKLADMVVLSKDLFEIPPQEILKTKVVYTILGGRVIYENRKPSEKQAIY